MTSPRKHAPEPRRASPTFVATFADGQTTWFSMPTGVSRWWRSL